MKNFLFLFEINYLYLVILNACEILWLSSLCSSHDGKLSAEKNPPAFSFPFYTVFIWLKSITNPQPFDSKIQLFLAKTIICPLIKLANLFPSFSPKSPSQCFELYLLIFIRINIQNSSVSLLNSEILVDRYFLPFFSQQIRLFEVLLSWLLELNLFASHWTIGFAWFICCFYATLAIFAEGFLG